MHAAFVMLCIIVCMRVLEKVQILNHDVLREYESDDLYII
jgi:hypothetical protein